MRGTGLLRAGLLTVAMLHSATLIFAEDAKAPAGKAGKAAARPAKAAPAAAAKAAPAAPAKAKAPTGTKPTTVAKPKSLFDRLGGKPAITAVVDQFVTNCATDKRINRFFTAAAADPKRLATFKGKLVEQICQASGGPCTYTGKDMKTAHKGMNIKDADFAALVEDLTKAMDKLKVGEKEKGELLGALGPMKNDIVGM